MNNLQASVDIGTNTVLLLIAEVKDDNLRVIHEEQRIPRLGRGVDEARNLSKDAMMRVVGALEDYQQLIEEQYPAVECVEVVGTSAVRDAENRNEFSQLIKQKTGLDLQILSGIQEAEFTFLGALSVLDAQYFSKQSWVIDIGGGSTEIAFADNQQLEDYYSFNMGCVRLTERYLEADPPKPDEVENCRSSARNILQKHAFEKAKKATLIGVSGTLTSLAFIDLEMDYYQPQKINGYIISSEKIADYINEFSGWPSSKLKEKFPVVMKGRSDIFLTGLLILEQIMQHYSFSEIVVSSGGIKHGTLMKS